MIMQVHFWACANESQLTQIRLDNVVDASTRRLRFLPTIIGVKLQIYQYWLIVEPNSVVEIDTQPT